MLPPSHRERAALTVLTGLAALLWWALAPATINGDGIGYLKQLSTTDLSPGHLGYLPLARAVGRLGGQQTPMDLATPLRLLSVVACAIGLWFCYAAARRLWPARQALFCTALLAASHAYWRAGQEVEVYGVATLFAAGLVLGLVLYLTEPTPRWRWAAAVGLAAGLAPMMHLTLALLAAPAVLLIGWCGRWRHAALAASIAGVIGITLLLLALRQQEITTAAESWRWLRSADHGMPYPLSALTPLVALWGLAKSLIAVPYLYEASTLRVVLQSAAAATAWIVLIWLARTRSGGPTPRAMLPQALGLKRTVALLVAPLAAFGVYFFPSDTERWVLLMPAICLLFAPAASRAGVALLVVVALANAGLRLPAALHRGEIERAEQADRLLGPRDLLVSPGHGWSELVGLATTTPAQRFPLVYHAGAERDLTRATRLMRERMAQAWQGGGRVFVARLRDRSDRRGFKELERNFALSRSGFAALFADHSPRPSSVPGLWLLRAAGAPEPADPGGSLAPDVKK